MEAEDMKTCQCTVKVKFEGVKAFNVTGLIVVPQSYTAPGIKKKLKERMLDIYRRADKTSIPELTVGSLRTLKSDFILTL